MSDVLDRAGQSRRASRSYMTLSALDEYPQYHDAADDTTRTLAERDSDSALVVVFAKGARASIVDAFNERSRLTFQLRAAEQGRKDWIDKYPDDADTSGFDEQIVGLSDQIKAIGKVTSVPTVQVARALSHYASAVESVESVEE